VNYNFLGVPALCAPKRLELAFVLEFLFLFVQAKRKEEIAFGYFSQKYREKYQD
jgi:hypothetical protein